MSWVVPPVHGRSKIPSSAEPKDSEGFPSRSRCQRNRTEENTSWRTIMQANTTPLLE